MQDRTPLKPGRVKITPEGGGAAYYATMERADEPTQEGTPLDKNSLLKDETAALYGLGVEAVPDEIFAILSKSARIEVGSYVGTGTYGFDNPSSLKFGVDAKVVLISYGNPGNANNYGMYKGIFFVPEETPTEYHVGSYILFQRGTLMESNADDDRHFKYKDKTLSWYSRRSTTEQLNEKRTYFYIAFGV